MRLLENRRVALDHVPLIAGAGTLIAITTSLRHLENPDEAFFRSSSLLSVFLD